ncbi:uncharacterized protein LOC135384342 [Ornithodoros turicata]|uniref:uncharacterized protein LOC135384342 n=1 Tax=Ornithodoros turicata TaxID=34597 RepID=UPI003139CA0D
MVRLTDLLAQPNPSGEDMEVVLEYLITKRQALYDLDRSILEATPEDELDAELSVALEYEQNLEEAIARARRSLRRIPSSAPVVQQRSEASKSVALPKLQIPKFSSKLQERQQFWEHFDVSIHSNQALATVEKFKYLASSLVDGAKRTIEGIRINGDNYPTAIAALKLRYGRPGLLTSEHIDGLLALRPVTCSEQVFQLRHVLGEVSFRTSALAALDVPKEHYAVILERVITRCLRRAFP